MFFRTSAKSKPRACVTVKGIDAKLIPDLCFRDVVAVEIEVIGEADRSRKMVVGSAYFDGLVSEPVTRLVEYCQDNQLSLVVRCNSNAHHTQYGEARTRMREGSEREAGRCVCDILMRHSLHFNQHTYRMGCFTDTALHLAVSVIEEWLEEDGYVVGTFLESVLHNTPQVVCREA